jgi:hypothetical protein
MASACSFYGVVDIENAQPYMLEPKKRRPRLAHQFIHAWTIVHCIGESAWTESVRAIEIPAISDYTN